MARSFLRILLVASLTATASCSETPPAPVDSGTPLDAPVDGGLDSGLSSSCAADGNCDDGLFCTGVERCMPTAAGADARGCVAAVPPCSATETCDEVLDSCMTRCADFDGDGATDSTCGGTDCDDMDERRYPGATEVCDAVGVDEDCNPATFGPDADADRYVSDACCNRLPTGRLDCGADCDDTSSGINPEAVDTCGSGDQDCDGMIDENPDTVFYRDIDGDGFGVDAMTMLACAGSAGWAVLPGDCDDTLSGVNPGVGEPCNARDDNCDGSVDEGCTCVDGRSETCGPTDVGSCRFGSRTCVAGAWPSCSGLVTPSMELCEGVEDEDCDGVVDNGCACISGNSRICGMSVGVCRSVTQVCSAAGQWPRDCADEVGVISPSAEVCEGVQDENCDGGIDEGCLCVNGAVDRSACGTDTGECVSGMRTCTAGAWGACSGGVSPAAEACEGSRDENCDGAIDEGCGCTNGMTQPCGVGACASTRTCVSGTWGACMGASPGVEVCDGVDNDCDGFPDASDGDTQMVGATCGTATGLCTTGTYSCPGASLVCNGVAAAAEVCDHRDNDCDGQLDNGVGVATCNFSAMAVAGSTTLASEFICSWGFCNVNAAGRIDELTTRATSTAPRIASLRPGGSLPDWGDRMTVQGTFYLGDLTAGAIVSGPVGVFIAPSAVPSTGTTTTQGLPVMVGAQYGFAALYQTNGFLHRIEIWEMTPGGNLRRRSGSALEVACLINTTTLRRFVVTLTNVGATFTASVSATGCTTSTATYVAPNWQSQIYGDSETLPYPQYQVGAMAWNSGNLIAHLHAFSVTRTNTAAGGHCVTCPW